MRVGDGPCHTRGGHAINLPTKRGGKNGWYSNEYAEIHGSRRQVLKTGTAATLLAMAPGVLRAQERAIKIGLVTPATGPLAIFAEPDAFVLGAFRSAVGGGIKIGSKTHPVEVIVKDS